MYSRRSARQEPWDASPVAVSVETVLFTIHNGKLAILLVRRGIEPYRGTWALPGAFVRPDETLDAAAARALARVAGVETDEAYLEQLASYGELDRDPTMRVVTVAFLGACHRLRPPEAGPGMGSVTLKPTAMIENDRIHLAFDHRKIVLDALRRLRFKLQYTTLATRFCKAEFTITELRRVFETIWNTRLDPGNFQRKIRGNDAFRMVSGPNSEDSSKAESGQDYSVADIRSGVQQMAVPRSAAPTPRRVESRRGTGRGAKTPRPKRGRPASLWGVARHEGKLDSPTAEERRRRQWLRPGSPASDRSP